MRYVTLKLDDRTLDRLLDILQDRAADGYVSALARWDMKAALIEVSDSEHVA